MLDYFIHSLYTAKNEARKKCIIRDTRANKEEYIKRRNEAGKICRDKKREMINNEIEELEIENGKNENRKFYKKLETLTKTYKPRNRNIKAHDGSVLTDEKGILNRWNEHFKGEQSVQPFEFYENKSYDYIDEEIEEPTLDEIQEIIRNLKRMKTPGTDNINPLPLLFKALLQGQKDRVFFSEHLNLHTTPEPGLPSRKKKS